MTPRSGIRPREPRDWLIQYIATADDPELVRYGSEILQEAQASPDPSYLRFVTYLMRLGGMAGSEVLDIGCGFGWEPAMVAIIGENRVVANDIRPTMIAATAKRVEYLRAQGATIRVEPQLGDVCDPAFDPGRFDAILCNEAVEHIWDLDSLFANCHKLLRPSGVLVLSGSSNALFPGHAAQRQELWTLRDQSQDYVDELVRGQPVENAGAKPYATMRERIIVQSRPDLDAGSLVALIKATAGMRRPEIERLADGFRRGMDLPDPPEHAWCRNPETGEYCERLLDPFELRDSLAWAGFRASVHHGFLRWPYRLANRTHMDSLDRLLFRLRPTFVLRAVRGAD